MRKLPRLMMLCSLGMILALAGCDSNTSVPQPQFNVVNSNADTDQGLDWFPTIDCSLTGICIAAWVAGEDDADPFPATNALYYSKRVAQESDTWSPRAVLGNTVGDMDIDWKPSLATDNNGTWICAWEHGGGGGSEIDILITRSLDDGDTWEPSVIVSGPDPRSDTEPSICTDGLGSWLVAWDAPGINQPSSVKYSEHDLFRVYSTDNGATWSSVTPLNVNAGSDASIDSMLSVSAGTVGSFLAVWASFERPGSSPSGIYFARSFDAGNTWSVPELISPPNPDGYYRRDPVLASSGDGRLMAAWLARGDYPSTDAYLEYAFSSDTGDSWTIVAFPDVDSPEVQFAPTLSFIEPGRWAAAWMYINDVNEVPYVYGVSWAEFDDNMHYRTPAQYLFPFVNGTEFTHCGEPNITVDALGRPQVILRCLRSEDDEFDIVSAALP